MFSGIFFDSKISPLKTSGINSDPISVTVQLAVPFWSGQTLIARGQVIERFTGTNGRQRELIGEMTRRTTLLLLQLPRLQAVT